MRFVKGVCGRWPPTSALIRLPLLLVKKMSRDKRRDSATQPRPRRRRPESLCEAAAPWPLTRRPRRPSPPSSYRQPGAEGVGERPAPRNRPPAPTLFCLTKLETASVALKAAFR